MSAIRHDLDQRSPGFLAAAPALAGVLLLVTTVVGAVVAAFVSA